jgi:putative Mg2+ transporter-C (MgtC) family protein
MSSRVATFPQAEIRVRLALAALFGAALGIDRELRGIAAGLRTHALVSLSAAAITISALMMAAEAREVLGQDLDPLRVIQGLAQAIGFIAAGLIFVHRQDVHNITSAANLWLATAVGIAAGAGQLFLAGVAVGFGVVIVTLMRVFERWIPGSNKERKD